MKIKRPRNILPVLLLFLGIGAIGGGGMLIISPAGTFMGMPLTILKNSPFGSFLVPGIILFFVLGVFPVAMVFALLKKPDNKLAERINFFKDMHWSWTFSIYVAFILIIWIQLEMVFLHAVHWLHTFYMFFALCIIFAALLPQVKNEYKKNPDKF